MSVTRTKGQPEPAFATIAEAWQAAKGVICRAQDCPGDASPYWVGRAFGGYVLRCSFDRSHRITAPDLLPV